MFIYILILCSLIVGNIFDFMKVKERNLVFFINFLFIFLIVSTRYGIGPDYFLYEGLYTESKPISNFIADNYIDNPHNIELGYLLLQSIMKSFTNDFSTYLFFYNAIVFIFILFGILKTKHYNFQLFIFFSLFHIYYISGQRQVMAMALFFYNINNLINGKDKRFVLITLMGCFFHIYSIMYFLPFFLLKFRILAKRSFVIFVSIMVLFVSYSGIIKDAIEFLYLHFGGYSYIFQRIYYYYFEHYAVGNINILNVLKMLSLFFLILIFWNYSNYKINVLLLLGIFLFFLFIQNGGEQGGLAFRLSEGLLIGLMFYCGAYISNFSYQKRLLVYIFITIYGSITFLRILYVHFVFDVSTFLPYESILL